MGDENTGTGHNWSEPHNTFIIDIWHPCYTLSLRYGIIHPFMKGRGIEEPMIPRAVTTRSWRLTVIADPPMSDVPIIDMKRLRQVT